MTDDEFKQFKVRDVKKLVVSLKGRWIDNSEIPHISLGLLEDAYKVLKKDLEADRKMLQMIEARLGVSKKRFGQYIIAVFKNLWHNADS